MADKFIDLLRDGEKIGHVRYRANLSEYLGITKTKKTGEFALIHGSREDAYAVIVSDEEALEAIVKSGNAKMLRPRSKYDRLIKDSEPVLIENTHEMTSVKKVRLIGKSYFIHISMREMDLLDLQAGDSIEVTFRKTDREKYY